MMKDIDTDISKSVYTAEIGDEVEGTEVVLPLLLLLLPPLLLLLLLLLIASFASFAHSGRVSIPLTRLPPNFIVIDWKGLIIKTFILCYFI